MAAGKDDELRDPLGMIVYACLAWLGDDQSTNADTAFRHGLAGLADGEEKQERGADALALAVELLKRVENHSGSVQR